MKSAAEWVKILTDSGVKPGTAVRWSESFASEVLGSRFSAGTPEISGWVANFLHETAMLEKMEENLNYSAERMAQVWPTRFAKFDGTGRRVKNAAGLFIPNDIAFTLERNPVGLANSVYGGRLGNTKPNDGWDYRGRGGGLTGRDNYRTTGLAVGVDLEADPDLAASPLVAIKVFIAWWEGHVPDSIVGDVKKVRRVVNGGEIGLTHVAELTEYLQERLA